jgi:hypothetical protein
MKRLALFLSIALAMPALADNPPLSQSVFNGPTGITKVGTLCSAQTATSTGCTGTVNGTSDQLVADLRGFTSVAFYSNQSASTSYTCDVYSSDNGYDSDSGVGQDRSTTSLSETQEMIVLDGALGFVWVECSSIANSSVTVTFVAK